MSKICKLCKSEFPSTMVIDGKKRNFNNRMYCFECSPWGAKNSTDLSRYGKTVSELPLKSERQKQKNKETYRRFRLSHPGWQEKRRKERKQQLVDLYGGQCIKCGYNRYIGALEFHHRDPKQKKFAISHTGLLRKWDNLVEESNKCDLLCSNCHKEIHYK